jgi:hypothetical protein
VLLAGDEATILLSQSNAFLMAHPQMTWSGTIKYQDAAAEHRAQPFTLTAEHERLSLVHNEEDPKTQFELQKIPDRLEHIAAEHRAQRWAKGRPGNAGYRSQPTERSMSTGSPTCGQTMT